MKKRLLALACLLSVLLYACQNVPGSSDLSTHNGNANSRTNLSNASSIPDVSSDIQLVTSCEGATQLATTDNGAYQLSMLTNGGMLLNYIDYQSKSRISLCTRPECLHQDDTCTAWIPQCGGVLFTNGDKSRLFCVTYADAVQQTPDTIWEIALDGSSKEVVLQLDPKENFIDAVAANDSQLFFAVRSFSGNSSEAKKQLYLFDLNTRERYLLSEYGDADWLYGAFEHTLVILSYNKNGNERFVYYLYNLDTKETKEIYSYGYNESGERGISKTNGSDIYIIEPYGDDLAIVKRLDMKTGKIVDICRSLPYYNCDNSFVQGFFDGKMIIDITDANEQTKEINHYRYAVDCQSGNFESLTLTIQHGDLSKFLPILASVPQNRFLVITEYVDHEIMLAGNDGTYYSTNTYIPEYALIDCDDYWKSIENFIPILDVV